MHDCLKTQEEILDLVLNEIEPREQKPLLDEAASRAFCRAELESFEKTLEIYDRAVAFTDPTAAEWQTFKINLQNQFVGHKKPATFWRQILFGTIKVPAPIFAAACLFVCGVTFFAARSVKPELQPQKLNSEVVPEATARQNLPAVLTNDKELTEKESPIEKIIIREVERVVTRKIYVVKKTNAPKVPKTTIAETGIEMDSSPLNLAEFKPVRPAPQAAVKDK